MKIVKSNGELQPVGAIAIYHGLSVAFEREFFSKRILDEYDVIGEKFNMLIHKVTDEEVFVIFEDKQDGQD